MRTNQIFFYLILTVTLFSLWAAFALLIVNPYLAADLPGYTLGQICIWEGVALVAAGLLAWSMIRKWGTIQTARFENERRLVIHPNYGRYFVIYFLLAASIAVWQFWIFSQSV
jgi:hypothetical protein